jgi:hypothetical protein
MLRGRELRSIFSASQMHPPFPSCDSFEPEVM